MKIRIKKLSPETQLPQYMRPDDAGMDLVAVSKHFDESGNAVYCTGLAIEVPPGYVGLLFPRSSNAKVFGLFSHKHWVANTCSTSLVPMPKANVPKAPSVEVWLSPHTMTVPGRVNPNSGAMICTMP